MNTKQLQYVLQLTKSRSFSQAAQELCVSQPALSKQIQSLEKELGDDTGRYRCDAAAVAVCEE